MESAFDLFLKGYETSQAMTQRRQEAEAQKALAEQFSKIYGEDQPTTGPTFAQKPPTDPSYVKGTGFGGQDTMMPPGAMSLTPDQTPMADPLSSLSNQTMQADATTVPGYQGRDVAAPGGYTAPAEAAPSQTNPHQDWLSANQKIQNFDQQLGRVEKQISLANKLQGNPKTLELGLKLRKQFEDERSKIYNDRKDQQSIVEKQNEMYAGILTNINSQQDLDIARMRLQKEGVPLPATLEMPRMNPDGTPMLDQRGQPVMDQVRSDVFSPQLQKYTNSLGMSLLDANKQTTIKNQLSEIENRGAGGKGAQQMNRIVISSEQAIEDIKNLSTVGSATSYAGFKTGKPGLLGATKDSLVNKFTKQDAQNYDIFFTGLTRNLATIESVGAATGLVGLSEKMEALRAKPNDTIETRLRKLSQARQIVETGINFAMNEKSIQPAQKEKLGKYLDELKVAVPFTQADVTALNKSSKNVALDDIVQDRIKKAEAKGGPKAEAPAQKATVSTTAAPKTLAESLSSKSKSIVDDLLK
jgi:hypothetical protein